MQTKKDTVKLSTVFYNKLVWISLLVACSLFLLCKRRSWVRGTNLSVCKVTRWQLNVGCGCWSVNLPQSNKDQDRAANVSPDSHTVQDWPPTSKNSGTLLHMFQILEWSSLQLYNFIVLWKANKRYFIDLKFLTRCFWIGRKIVPIDIWIVRKKVLTRNCGVCCKPRHVSQGSIRLFAFDTD